METTLAADRTERSPLAASQHWLVRHSRLALAAVTVLGLGLRLWNLGHKSFWYDEAVLFWIAEAGWTDLLARNAAGNSAPPLFAALVTAMSTVATREDGLRLVPLLFGVLTIPAVYWAVRGVADTTLVLASAFTTPIAPTAIQYSQYLREYSLAMLVAAILVGAAARHFVHGSRRDWLIVLGGSALALQVQYGLAFIVAAIGLGCLVRALRVPIKTPRRSLVSWCVSERVRLSGNRWEVLIGVLRAGRVRSELPRLVLFGLAVGASALVAWWTALSAQFQPGGWGASLYLRAYYWDGSLDGLIPFVVSRLFRLLAMPFHSYPPSLVESLPAVLVVVGGLTIAMARPATRPFAAIAVTSVGLTAMAAVLHLYPLGPIRQNTFLLTALYALAPLAFVGALHLLNRLRVPASALVATVLALGFMLAVGLNTVETVTFRGWEDMRALVGQLERERRPRDTVLVDPAAAPQFRYYYTPQPNDGVILFGGNPDAPEDPVIPAIEQIDGRVLLVTLEWAERDSQRAQQISPNRPVRLLADETGAQLYLIDSKPTRRRSRPGYCQS